MLEDGVRLKDGLGDETSLLDVDADAWVESDASTIELLTEKLEE